MLILEWYAGQVGCKVWIQPWRDLEEEPAMTILFIELSFYLKIFNISELNIISSPFMKKVLLWMVSKWKSLNGHRMRGREGTRLPGGRGDKFRSYLVSRPFSRDTGDTGAEMASWPGGLRGESGFSLITTSQWKLERWVTQFNNCSEIWMFLCRGVCVSSLGDETWK